ncbi:hypothetical protein BKA80DRAFT_4884 [Phyllosticta citrichinensis]
MPPCSYSSNSTCTYPIVRLYRSFLDTAVKRLQSAELAGYAGEEKKEKKAYIGRGKMKSKDEGKRETRKMGKEKKGGTKGDELLFVLDSTEQSTSRILYCIPYLCSHIPTIATFPIFPSPAFSLFPFLSFPFLSFSSPSRFVLLSDFLFPFPAAATAAATFGAL